MTTIPTPGAYTVTAPSRGALVHFHQVGSYVNAIDTPEYGGRSTSCGRRVPVTWTARPVAAADAVQLVTCPRCLEWARYHHVAQLAAAVAMPQLRRDLFAADAANSAQRYVELLELLAAAEPQLVHLMDADGLDTCGTAPAGRLVTAPDTTPERITCPRCRELMAKAEHADDGRHVHTEWTQCRHRGGQCCAACHVSNFPNGTPAERMAVLEAEQALPPVHGPHGPERFGAVLSAETLLDRGRRAILRADQLQRAARSAVQLLPPAGTLHA